MAWADGVVAREADDGGAPTWQHHPLLLTACGSGDYGELGYDPPEEAEAAVAQLSAKKGAWRPKKKRRPALSSSRMRPVCLPLLDALATPLSDPTAAAAGPAGPWEVEELHASHLHSCVVLRARGGGGGGDARALHWGCYYNGAVEGLESSRPREVDDDGGAPPDATAMVLHGGDEFLLRCNARAPDGGPYVAVLGGDDIFNERGMCAEEEVDVRTWRPLPAMEVGQLPPDAVVRRATGRAHALLLVDRAEEGPDGAAASVVMGFGSNLHGELGLQEREKVAALSVGLRGGQAIGRFDPAARKPDTASTPRQAWRVARVRDVAAGTHHSVFLLDIIV
ncbi:chromatin binding protein [Strigomonas culicis]|uniref:Chromatin binding protein n=1 Tax=Strigomonas culicis TaxID=28005 RepID=S9VMI4_9TRYP|nr:chromatin binding protein [Strigomonas culicis]|eukprot:EPY24425.1 chromatin binding protein [Strigomonas culicis]